MPLNSGRPAEESSCVKDLGRLIGFDVLLIIYNVVIEQRPVQIVHMLALVGVKTSCSRTPTVSLQILGFEPRTYPTNPTFD